jgi:hypothetical protein
LNIPLESITIVFFSNLYFVSMVTMMVYILKIKTIAILLLFMLSPWFSDLSDSVLLHYSPFNLPFTILKNARDKIQNVDFIVLGLYMLLIIIAMIKYKTNEKKN